MYIPIAKVRSKVFSITRWSVFAKWLEKGYRSHHSLFANQSHLSCYFSRFSLMSVTSLFAFIWYSYSPFAPLHCQLYFILNSFFISLSADKIYLIGNFLCYNWCQKDYLNLKASTFVFRLYWLFIFDILYGPYLPFVQQSGHEKRNTCHVQEKQENEKL